MKKILSLLLVLIMVFSITAFASAATPFNDIYYSKNSEAINTLYGLGILEGYGNGKYGPGNTLTRAEACAIIVRAMVEDDLIYESRANTFTDVDYFAWYRAYVDTAYRHNYMHGYGKTFGPNDNVTYAQFATIVLNMLGYNCPKLPGSWPANAIEYATYLGLYHNVSRHNDNNFITREDAAQMLYNALNCDMVKWSYGRIVKTGETLKQYLTDNYYVYTAYIYNFVKEGNYVKYTLTDTTVGYCEWAKWDNRIVNGDHVEITLDYLGRTVRVDFCHRPENVIDNIYDIKGYVTNYDTYKDGSFKMIEINGIVYDAIDMNINKVTSLDGSTFKIGAYVYAYYDTNNVIKKLEIKNGGQIPTPPVVTSTVEGVVIDFERYTNEQLNYVVLEDKGTHYFALNYSVENPENIGFEDGVIATLTIQNGYVIKMSFKSNPDWDTNEIPEVNPDPSNGADDVLDDMGVIG